MSARSMTGNKPATAQQFVFIFVLPTFAERC
jgi:hypothetical protein